MRHAKGFALACLAASQFAGGCTDEPIAAPPAYEAVGGSAGTVVASGGAAGTRSSVGGSEGSAQVATGNAASTSSGSGASSSTAPATGGGAQRGGEAGSAAIPSPAVLLGAPLVFAPTDDGFGVSVVLASGDPSTLRVYVREAGSSVWSDVGTPDTPAPDLAQWLIIDRKAGTRYEYRVVTDDLAEGDVLFQGSAVTQRPAGQPFSFALVTDTHIEPRAVRAGETATVSFQETTLAAIAPEVMASAPDFIVNLGDMLDFHCCGFNQPPPDSSYTRAAYLNYRRLWGDVLGNAAHFPVIGNWDGENGDFLPEQIAFSREQRLLYAPGPAPDSYAEGASDYEDYYAFSWGDALFVVLNVMTYTPTSHLLGLNPGLPDDWTLGPEQLGFLEETLKHATSSWRFLLIHHAVGGAAGDPINSAYGRGGGQAAHVGEQATVHQLMQTYGVQVFFYGHDHVFTDIIVDDIHYTLPGSAGAPWKFSSAQTGYTQYWTESGHARVSVDPDSVKVEFIALGGALLHSYTLP